LLADEVRAHQPRGENHASIPGGVAVKEPVKNIAASILARLRNQSDEMNRPFAEVLQYFAMERFLHRLSKTRYADKFILKGGLLFYV
ncbi:MAG TPA: hypothetical protein PLA27_15435, partial [Anaerolineales bacterium]|nr:hypothetical protein [Anaerolineales bacterium]